MATGRGSVYGMLRVTFVARPAQVAAIGRDGLRLAMGGRAESLRNVAATTDLAAALADAAP